MAISFSNSDDTSTVQDPLFPWLLSIKQALDTKIFSVDLNNLLSDCIATFKHNVQYKNDHRFLKIWFLYLEGCNDFERVFKDMEDSKICSSHSLVYELYAGFLEAKEKWQEAHMVYQIGISRGAEPLERLKCAQVLFLKRMSHRVCSLQEINSTKSIELEKKCVYPWSSSTKEELWNKITPQITKYNGYLPNNKFYSGKVALSSLRNAPRNKIIEIGRMKYQIKGCVGQGGFGQVFKAYVNNNPDDVVALKIQKPAFPWEFYIYRQLDQRILDKHRSKFGFAHRMHLYLDYSILVCDYLSHGTLQDVINSYVVTGKSMEEVLCIYYTIEMLCMLENLHSVGLIHGDFKPDNLLVRYSRVDLTADGFHDKNGPWSNQGLCLVDWGKGIDLHLFPDDIEFEGDCRTSGFRCIEMQEKRPWKFQVDTYGFCVAVHMMLHGSYMETEKKAKSDGGYIYLPKAPFKRYWQVDLWKELFTQLLNSNPCSDNELKNLRERFEDHLYNDRQLLKKLKDVLAKQRVSLNAA